MTAQEGFRSATPVGQGTSGSNSPSCSVVIRAFNEERHIERLLTGIEQQSLGEVEVVLVDSGSTDSTVSIAQRHPVNVVSIDPREFTFGRSLNLGCSQARGEIIVAASAHVYPVYPDWLERLVEPFQDPRVALVYGKQRGNSGTRFSEEQHFAKLYSESSTLDQDHPFCNNANAAIRRKLWLSRPYNEELTGLEDLEWASWALSEGHRIAYVSEAEVIHVHEETPRQVYNRYRREAIALKRLRPHEHFSIVDFLRLYLSNAVSDGRHAFRQGSLVRVLPEILWFRFMQFWGTYRGFVHRGPLSPELKRTFYYPRGFQAASQVGARPVEPIDYEAGVAEPKEG